jgi:hypothetical protein
LHEADEGFRGVVFGDIFAAVGGGFVGALVLVFGLGFLAAFLLAALG